MARFSPYDDAAPVKEAHMLDECTLLIRSATNRIIVSVICPDRKREERFATAAPTKLLPCRYLVHFVACPRLVGTKPCDSPGPKSKIRRLICVCVHIDFAGFSFFFLSGCFTVWCAGGIVVRCALVSGPDCEGLCFFFVFFSSRTFFSVTVDRAVVWQYLHPDRDDFDKGSYHEWEVGR